jgi:uncharacterized protein (TIGR02117 family)
LIRIIRWLAVLLLAIGVAIVGGAIPVPTGASQAAAATGTVRIYVLSNGFHSDIAIPYNDGRALARFGIDPSDFPVAPNGVRYWAIGWGSQTAYTSLLDISDLTAGIIVRALAFDVSVMHIQPLGEIAGGEGVYAIDLSRDQYSRLFAGIRRSFGGAIRPIADITQGFGDRFYRADGRFSAINGCNVWTGRRLREAGVGVGVWPVFAQSLEFGLARVAAP